MQNQLKNKNAKNSDMWTAIRHLQKTITVGGINPRLLTLVHLCVSQITSCPACVYAGVAGGKRSGDIDERLHYVGA